MISMMLLQYIGYPSNTEAELYSMEKGLKSSMNIYSILEVVI